MIEFAIKIGIYLASLGAAVLLLTSNDTFTALLAFLPSSSSSAIIQALTSFFELISTYGGFAMGFINNFFSPAGKTALILLIKWLLIQPIIKLIIWLVQKTITRLLSNV